MSEACLNSIDALEGAPPDNAVKLWSPPLADWSEELSMKARATTLALARIVKAHPSVALATSLQAESVVLADLIARAELPIALILIDTGRLPPETLEAKRDVEARYGLEISVCGPAPLEVKQWVSVNGADGFYDSEAQRKACCDLRKVRPLARALEGRTAWITGQRRDQTHTRANLREHEIDSMLGIDKFNPLADWTEADIWAYVREHDVPVNALYARGYASIGCAPCTRAVRADEDTRAGRWWWEQSDVKECGLHMGAGI